MARKIFVSYSWSSPTHEKFVIELAERLTIDGVEVIIDKWELKEGQDKYAFMEKMVSDESVNKVLVISDRKYSEKADQKKGGVGAESQIISSEIYNKIDQTKFIPIVTEFDENGSPFLPVFLKNRIYINLADSNVYLDEYDKLLRNIYDKPLFKKPSLGTPPSHILDEYVSSVKTTIKYNSLREAIIKEKTISKALASEYFDLFLETLEDFRVPDKNNDVGPIDEQIVNSINRFLPYQRELLLVFRLLIETTNDFYYYELIFKFFEKFIVYKYPPAELNQFNEIWFDNYRFFMMEFFLYLSALLINSNKIDELNFFLDELYFIDIRFIQGSHRYTVFNEYLNSLDTVRKQRMNLNRISITADLLHDRCQSKNLSFEEVMQADFILTLKSVFDNSNRYDFWFPRTLVYKGWANSRPFPLFFRGETKRYFDIICHIFKIKTKEELRDKFQIANGVFNFENWHYDYRSIPFESYMNLEKLYKT